MLTVFVEGACFGEGEEVVVPDDEARHALRVRRAQPGEAALVLNGKGLLGRGRVVLLPGRRLAVRLEQVEQQPSPPAPRIRVLAPLPKGPRAGELVDLLSQAGACSWTPLLTKRSSRKPTAALLARLGRVAVAACKQSRRPWLLRVDEPLPLAEALDGLAGAASFLADPQGPTLPGLRAQEHPADLQLFVGPEGGFEAEELEAIAGSGA
ncbi:MAG: RsmE family RNA methyltransferase, partial [Planctomycetota bacterium]